MVMGFGRRLCRVKAMFIVKHSAIVFVPPRTDRQGNRLLSYLHATYSDARISFAVYCRLGQSWQICSLWVLMDIIALMDFARMDIPRIPRTMDSYFCDLNSEIELELH